MDIFKFLVITFEHPSYIWVNCLHRESCFLRKKLENSHRHPPVWPRDLDCQSEALLWVLDSKWGKHRGSCLRESVKGFESLSSQMLSQPKNTYYSFSIPSHAFLHCLDRSPVLDPQASPSTKMLAISQGLSWLSTLESVAHGFCYYFPICCLILCTETSLTIITVENDHFGPNIQIF